jgi:hypothetical protein
MSCIQLYAVEEDIKKIFDWFSQEEEIAFVVPNGKKRWKASGNHAFQGDGHYILWHVPSGPLPFVRANNRDVEDYVSDPWQGWKEEVEGGYEDIPNFGPTSVGTLELDANIVLRRQGSSVFETDGSILEQMGNFHDFAIHQGILVFHGPLVSF